MDTDVGVPGYCLDDSAALVVAPVVSLYVNAFNAPALRTYAAAGYSQRGRFATIIY